MGRHSGKELLKELHNAKNSVKIISPYLGPDYIKELIGLKEKGLKVSLITSDYLETSNYSDFTHQDVIKQDRKVLEHAVEERKSLLNYSLITLSVFGISIFTSLITQMFSLIFFSLIPLTIGCLMYYFYSIKKIYEYSYYSLFDLRIFHSQYCKEEKKNDFLIHAKVYIIDDKILFSGSVNFTYSGIENSYECISKYTDNETLNYAISEYKKLFHNKNLHFKDINSWGKELYDELPN